MSEYKLTEKQSDADLHHLKSPTSQSQLSEVHSDDLRESISDVKESDSDYQKVSLSDYHKESGEYHDSVSEVGDQIDVISDRHLKQIVYELGLIKLCWPELEAFEDDISQFFPESYYRNSNKEKLILLYAENFRRQFQYNYPTRKQLILACENECGIQKFISTNIRPTILPYPEFYSWEGCAEFVADHVEFIILEKPTLIPEMIISPATLILREKGNSFEMAILLCSLLIGSGFDAYVVSGYATYDITHNLQIRVECPIILNEEEADKKKVIVKEDKYQLKPPRDLRSQFLLKMEQREVDREEEIKRQEREKQFIEIAELEKPPPDDLYGLRLHGWVLILPGKRDITEPFFIEPGTGVRKNIDDRDYLGIESIWNHENYWVNIQDCSVGIFNLSWDLWDPEKWEHFLVGEPIQSRKIGTFTTGEEGEFKQSNIEKHLDMPAPWCDSIEVPYSMLERRYPFSSKLINYKKCRVEKFSPYLQRDGMVACVSQYEDYEYCVPTVTYQFYKNRADFHYKTKKDLKDDAVVEYFERGRKDCCKEHNYYITETDMESRHNFVFYIEGRADGLLYLEMTPTMLAETYEGRDDRLISRVTCFAEKGSPPPGMIEGPRRLIVSITEKFSRDYSKKASQDIAVREFATEENEIRIKYHYEEGSITASTREFLKPPVTERGDRLTFNPDLTSGYQAEIGAKPSTQLELFYLLKESLEAEHAAEYHVRQMEDEVTTFLKLRSVEQAVPRLTVSMFHPERNEDAVQGIKEKEIQAMKQCKKDVANEIDYLALYLQRLNMPRAMTEKDAEQIRCACMKDFKQMLVKRVNVIQQHYEKKCVEIIKKQKNLDQIQNSLSPEEEDFYYKELHEEKFLLRTIEIRLSRFKELAKERYAAFEEYLNQDSRLKIC